MNRTWSIVGVFLALAFVVAPAAAADDGFQELFNGKDLSGWQNASGGEPGAGWVVEDGAMVRKQRAGDVWTKDRFGDFVLDLEFKTQGNSGVFIRTDNPRDCVQTGIEIQVDRPRDVPNRHSCGALYDLVAPSKEMSRADQWNRMVVTAKDNKITVAINGQQIAEMDLDLWTTPRQNPDGSGNKFGRALKEFKREGHIGLQDHGGAVSYRNIKIKPQ